MSQIDKMNTLLLTTSDLQTLTGSKRAKSIIHWLVEHNWAFEVAKNSQPRVSRSFFDARMNGFQLTALRSTPRVDFLFK